MYAAAERPDLWERGVPSESVWPEFNMHADVLNQWWPSLDQEQPECQFVLHDQAHDTVLDERHTGRLWWDGTEENLPRASTRPAGGPHHHAGEPTGQHAGCARRGDSSRGPLPRYGYQTAHGDAHARRSPPARPPGVETSGSSSTVDRPHDVGLYRERNVGTIHPDLAGVTAAV